MQSKLEYLGPATSDELFARHLVKAGHRVQLANRHGPASLKSLVGELGPNARASTALEVSRIKIVFVAIPWTEFSEAMSELPPWDGRIVIDANNHILGFDGKPFQLADLRGRTSSESFSEMVPGARLVKALNTLPAALPAQEPRVENGVAWSSFPAMTRSQRRRSATSSSLSDSHQSTSEPWRSEVGSSKPGQLYRV